MSSLFTRRLLGVAAVLAAWTVAVSALAQSNMGEIEGRCKGEDGNRWQAGRSSSSGSL